MNPPVKIVFLGRPRRDRTQLLLPRGRRPHPRRRLRDHVPRGRHARHRPRPPRLHLPARERRPRRGARSSPTRTKTTPAGSRSCCATSRSRSTARRCRSGWPATASKRPGMLGRTELIPVHDGERRMIGPFDCEFIPVTHSVPHAFATAYHTPAGTILHSGDFKLDLTPVDGRKTDLVAHRRDRRAERRREAAALRLHQRRAARVHAVGVDGGRHAALGVPRLPEPADDRRQLRVAPAPRAPGRRRRRSPPAARSCSSGARWCNNVALGREMGMLDIPVSSVIDIDEVPRYAPGEVCIICTGSQGEPMSALSLMAAHEHKHVKISERRRRRDLGARDPRQRDQRRPASSTRCTAPAPRCCTAAARRCTCRATRRRRS